MKRTIFAAALIAASTAGAHAGTMGTPTAEPEIPAPAAPAPSFGYDFSGGYVGTGLSFGRGLHSDSTAPGFWPNGSGAGLGAFAGYNWQSGNTVFGVEGHLSGQRMRGSTTTAAGEVQTDLRALASLRGRAGVTVDRTLFFATAGGALGSVRHNAVDVPASDTQTVRGLMVGVGVEHAISDGIHLRGDLEHYRFGSRNFNTTGPNAFTNVRTRSNMARVSAVFRF